jgi:hypothetical protein
MSLCRISADHLNIQKNIKTISAINILVAMEKNIDVSKGPYRNVS